MNVGVVSSGTNSMSTWIQRMKSRDISVLGDANPRAGGDIVSAESFDMSISGLVAEYIVAIDVTRVRFPADALSKSLSLPLCY